MGSIVPQERDNRFTAADLHQTIKSTFVEQVEFDRVIDSTNNRALQIAREREVQTPLLVLAEQQTDGRGRGSNTWWAQQGALTFSLLVETDATQLPPRLWPQASLTVGLAVCEALEEFVDEPVQLKWPNDVYIRRRKACGILIELPPERKQVIVIGIGVNVNNTVKEAPAELQSSATALCDVADRDFSLIEVLTAVLQSVDERLSWIGHRDDELRKRWRSRCMLTGKDVTIRFGTRTVSGSCHGIDDQGALMIKTDGQMEHFYSGVVTEF